MLRKKFKNLFIFLLISSIILLLLFMLFVLIVKPYGRSTLKQCMNNNECFVSGCNGEICQSKNEEILNSMCVFPNKPLPKQLGYQCQCYNNHCQWTNSFFRFLKL